MRLLKKRGTGEIFVWTESLARRADMEEYLGRAIQGPLGEKQTYPSEPIKTDTIEFCTSAGGIGDAVCALYVACGLANAGFKVLLHTKHQSSLNVEHPGVKILPDAKCFDINDNYDGQLEAAHRGDITSRLDWYLRNLSRQFDIRDAKPARPAKVEKPSRTDGAPFIVLAPITAGRSRAYPMAHWRRIAKLLLPKYRVLVLAGEDGRQAVDDGFFGMPVDRHIGLPIDTALRYYVNAECVVANDSGPAHLAGLYGTPCVAVISQARPDFLFECSPTVTCVTAQASCSGCYWQQDGGWDRVCEMGCSALYTIKPEEVCHEVERACAISEASRDEHHLHTDGFAGEPTGHGRVRARAEAGVKAETGAKGRTSAGGKSRTRAGAEG